MTPATVLLAILWCLPAVRVAAAAGSENGWSELLTQTENLTTAGRYDDAVRLATQALNEAEHLQAGGRQVAITLNHIGLLHTFTGQYSQARKAYLRGIRLLEDCACDNLVLSRLLDNLASLYVYTHTHERQAESLRRRAVVLGMSTLGPDHPDIGTLLSNFAATLVSRGRFSEAPALYEQALRLFEQSPGPYATSIGSVLTNRAVLAVRNGKASDAVPDLHRAIETYEKAVGEHHPDLLRPLVNLARVYLMLNLPALAAGPICRATCIAETALGRNHPLVGEVLGTYAVVLKKTGKKRESREMERRAQAIYTENPRSRPNTTVDLSDLLRPEKESR